MEKEIILIGNKEKTIEGMFNLVRIQQQLDIDEATLIGGDIDISGAYSIPTMNGMIVFIGNDVGSHSARIKVKNQIKGKGNGIRGISKDKFCSAYYDDGEVKIKGGNNIGLTKNQENEIKDFVIRNKELLELNKRGKISDDEFVNNILDNERQYYEKIKRG